VREGTRLRTGIVDRDRRGAPGAPHRDAVGYGASVVNPWMMFETVAEAVDEGVLVDETVTRSDRDEAEIRVARRSARAC
jgi:hypothetical protein